MSLPPRFQRVLFMLIRFLAPRRVVVCLALALLLANPAWQTAPGGEEPSPLTKPTGQEQKDQIAERDRLQALADDLDKAGQTQEAIQSALRAVKIQEQVLGETEAVADSWEWIAERHRKLDEFSKEQDARQKTLAIRTKVFGADHWKTVDAKLALEGSVRWVKFTDEERKQLREAEEKAERQTRLFEQGHYREALLLEEEVLQCQQRILGREDRLSVDSLHNLGFLHKFLGNYAKAESLYLESLAIERKILGEEHPDTANVLSNLSRLYEDMGRLKKAESLCQKALEIRRKTLGEDHEHTAFSLNNLASLSKAMGDLAKAESLYLKALEIRKKTLGEEHHLTAQTMNNLASVYEAQGDLSKAEQLYQQALDILRKVRGEDHLQLTLPLNNLGLLYMAKGDGHRAEPLLRQSLEITRKALGEEHPSTAISLNNLAGLYETQGELEKAEPLYRQALAIRQKVLGEEHLDTAFSFNNLAVLYEHMGDLKKAEPLHQKALAIRRRVLGEEHIDTASSLNNLAVFYEKISDYEKAGPLYQKAWEIKRKLLGAGHPDTALSLNNLGYFYIRTREYDKALPHCQEALDTTRRIFGEDHPDTGIRLGNLALLYECRGEYDKALPLAQKSLEIQRKAKGEEHRDTIGSLHCLARLYESMREYDKAGPLYEDTIDRMLRHIERTAVIQSQRQQLAMTRDARTYLDYRLSFALTTGRSQATLYRQILAWKGSILLRQKAIRAVANEPGLKADFAELEEATRQFAQLSLRVPTGQDRKAWQSHVDMLSEKIEVLEAGLTRGSLKFREALEPVTLETLKEALPADAVLVDFLEYEHHTPPESPGGRSQWEDRFAVFLVSRDQPVRMLSLKDARSIRQSIETWRQGFGRTPKSAEAGLFLRKTVWEPLEQEIPDANLVLISPDGALGKLPFAALPGKEPETFLIEERAVAVIAAPQDLPRLLAPAKPKDLKGNVLLVGDVNYDSDQPQTAPPPDGDDFLSQFAARGGEPLSFTRLLGTKGELATIRETYENRFSGQGLTRLMESEATEAAFRREAPHHLFLHVATHGFFAPPSVKSALDRTLMEQEHRRFDLSTTQSIAGYHPNLLSGLALAGANHPDPKRDDGILTAAEVMSLDLSNANLVVLSACETGLGEVAGGEGLLGLQRAFQVAGARTVVASLWIVDDAATRDLMERFYANLFRQEQKMSKLEALREAQLWMLKERGPRGLTKLEDDNPTPKRLPPYYWAGFVLSGDWR